MKRLIRDRLIQRTILLMSWMTLKLFNKFKSLKNRLNPKRIRLTLAPNGGLKRPSKLARKFKDFSKRCKEMNKRIALMISGQTIIRIGEPMTFLNRSSNRSSGIRIFFTREENTKRKKNDGRTCQGQISLSLASVKISKS